jgi:hypothetical protein
VEFFASFQFAGLLIGLAAGVLAARRGWDTVPGALGALGVFVLVMLIANLAYEPSLAAVVGAFVLGPVVGIVPVAAGFFAARWVARRLTRSDGRSRGGGNP